MFGKKRSTKGERPPRTVTPLGGTAAESTKGTEAAPTRLGETTQEFFREGERHEAAEWTDTQLPPDDEPEKDPAIKFKSFDRIAKRRSSTVALLVMSGGLVIAVATGVVAALRTEHVLSASLGSFFSFGARASEAKNESVGSPAALPTPIMLPDAGLPSSRPQGTGTATNTGRYP